MDRTASAAQLGGLEQALLREPLVPERAAAFHRAALAAGQHHRARELFQDLLKHHPHALQLHSYHAALSLALDDPGPAMASIMELVAAGAPGTNLIDAALSVRGRIGPLHRTRCDGNTLSLCMIVRNEAHRLGRCLYTLQPLVDEIIVVDTGSADRTREIAAIFGARVFDFIWCHDFAAARNFGLEKALGRWILVLDADEVMAPKDFVHLRELMARYCDNRTAFAIETRNYSHSVNAVGWHANDGRYAEQQAGLGWFPSTKVRLFPNDPRVRFRFPVHERVEASLRETGIRACACAVPVHHYGHLDAGRMREKALRYFELGYAKLGQLGEDAAAIRELAVQAGQLEHWPEAIQLWQRLLVIKPDFSEAFLNLAGACWNQGQYGESLKWAHKAAAVDPACREAHYNTAVSHLLLGDFQASISILQKVLAHHGDYLGATFMLAAAYGCIGERQQCRAELKQLQGTAAGPALALALEDLAHRLQNAGQERAAAVLMETALPLPGQRESARRSLQRS